VHKKEMNTYNLYLYLIPCGIAVAGAFPKDKKIRILCLVIATAVYWYFLQKSVDWAYTHPFNPNDGGARSFSAVLGWLIGLVTIILPSHFVSWFLVKRFNKLKLK